MILSDECINWMIHAMIEKYNHYPEPLDLLIEFNLSDKQYKTLEEFYEK
jgi:hypothetical protein